MDNTAVHIPENGTFYKRVNSVPLTKKERVIAQYLLDNSEKAGFMTASSIARDLNISDVTVIRFARKLGFDGFAELQATLQEEMARKLREGGVAFSIPSEKLDKTMSLAGQDSLTALAVSTLLENVDTLTSKNGDEVFEQAAKAIYASRRKFVLGLRGNSSVAESLALRLSYSVDNVHRVLRADPNDYDCLFTMKKDDCLIVYGFENYARVAVSAVQHARQVGATVIALTDKETSPLAFRTDICIYCSVTGISFNSFATVLLANEIIAAHLVKLAGKKAEGKNRLLLQQMKETNFFWDAT